jgi:hypothetical protein
LKGGEIREFLHAHVRDAFELELTVYERRELRFRPRSSTDGKPIVRVKPGALEALLAAEHGAAWAQYQADGVLPELPDGDDDEGDDDEGMRDLAQWDGLLALEDEDDADPDDAPTEEERMGDTLAYDPLPGFEGA